ncbi:Crp/Fnr family transcriptional regulator [Phytohabitans rumicis]|nr:cyclic nucleotide-binding domain-containing protein [Phytohabitans rumicis]
MNRQFGPGWTPGSFLASLPPDKCAELLASGVRRQFGAGRPLLREGELSTHVEVLIRGFVKVTNVLDGVEVLMAIRMPGDILGEMAALTGRPRMATVTTCGRVTSCVLSKGEFRRFLRENPAAALNMAAALGSGCAGPTSAGRTLPRTRPRCASPGCWSRSPRPVAGRPTTD